MDQIWKKLQKVRGEEDESEDRRQRATCPETLCNVAYVPGGRRCATTEYLVKSHAEDF